MCLTLEQFKLIKQVKDSSPFTCDQSLTEYIKGVKDRLGKWYGIDDVSLEMVYEYLKSTLSE